MIVPADYRPRPALLADRVILITGAGAGIGHACALAAAGLGATVILSGRTVSKLEQTYDRIEQLDAAPQPAIYPLNLETASPANYAELSETIGREFGRLDGLLHCAALFHGLTPLANLTAEHWYRTLQVNLNAPFLLTQALLEPLRRAPDAAVLFSHDRVGCGDSAYWGGYAVAKAGQQTLMKLLAQELEQNTALRVCCVDPGRVHTRLRLQAYPGGRRAHEDGRQTSPWRAPQAVTGGYMYCLGPDGRREQIHGRVVRL